MSAKEEKQEIIGIKVLGEKFENLTEFRFWDKIYAENNVKNVWISLVYGRNSVGKSSICKIAQNNIHNNETYKRILMCDNEKEFNYQNSRTETKVFNDEYKHRRVKQENQKLFVILPDDFHSQVYAKINGVYVELGYFVTESTNENSDHILWEIDFFKERVLKNYLRNESKYNQYLKKSDDVKNFKIIKKICDDPKHHVSLPFETPVWKHNENDFDDFIIRNKKSEMPDQKINESFEEKNISIIRHKFDKEIHRFLDNIQKLKFLYINIFNRFNEIKILLNYQEIINKVSLIWLKKLLKSKILDTLNNKAFDKDYYTNEENDWTLFNKSFLNYELSRIFKEINSIKLFLTEKINIISEMIKKNKSNGNFLPLDIITDNIKYITRTEHNLKFTIDDGTNFNLNIGEKTMQLKNLSTSEKNIVALVYFFVSTFIEIVKYLKDKKEKENKTFIIFIDDPVSSFDYEYKENLCSYIVNQLNFLHKFKKKGKKINIKIVVFTHDISAFNSIREDIKYLNEFSKNTNFLELKEDGVKMLNDKELIYTKLIQNVYDFVTSENSNSDILTSIGNQIRRVVEFFLKYSRNKTHKYIVSDDFRDECRDKLKSDKFYNSIKFANLIKFLNGESHQKSDLAEMKLSWCNTDSNINYKNIAEAIFCIIHIIDNKHIKNHLAPEQANTFDSNIEKWIKNIEETSNQTQHDILNEI